MLVPDEALVSGEDGLAHGTLPCFPPALGKRRGVLGTLVGGHAQRSPDGLQVVDAERGFFQDLRRGARRAVVGVFDDDARVRGRERDGDVALVVELFQQGANADGQKGRVPLSEATVEDEAGGLSAMLLDMGARVRSSLFVDFGLATELVEPRAEFVNAADDHVVGRAGAGFGDEAGHHVEANVKVVDVVVAGATP